MNYKEKITASFNKALGKKLRKEVRDAARGETKTRGTNAEHVKKRRHVEDMMLARELGVTIEELIE